MQSVCRARNTSGVCTDSAEMCIWYDSNTCQCTRENTRALTVQIDLCTHPDSYQEEES